MRCRSLTLAMISLGASLIAQRASAQSPACAAPSVTSEIDRALDDRRAGRALPAYDRLAALWRRCPSPRVRAQLALAEQALGRLPDARAHLIEALSSTQDPWIDTRRAVLEDALREITDRLPRLAPQTDVPGAELFVDGRSVGSLPLASPVVVPSGSATIELRAPGYHTLRRAISVPNGVVFREMLHLDAIVVALAPAPPPPRPIVVVSQRPRRSSAQRVIGWSAFGVGLALGGVGVWQAISWAAQSSDAASATASSDGELGAWARFNAAVNAQGGYSSSQVCDLASGASYSDPRTRGDASSVRDLCRENALHSALALGFGIGGALVTITGLALVLTAPGNGDSRTSLRVEPRIFGSEHGATLTLSF